jgi:hypothetical protein
MRQSELLEGFDYRTATKAERTLREWDEAIAKIVAAGGWVKRVGGDRTAFDSHGVMQLELHDAQLRCVNSELTAPASLAMWPSASV